MSQPTMTLVLDREDLDFIEASGSTVSILIAEVEQLASAAGFASVDVDQRPDVGGVGGVKVAEGAVDPDSEDPWVDWHDLACTVRGDAFTAIS